MRNEETDFPARGKNRSKGCLSLIAAIVLACFILILTAIVGIIALDSISLRGQGYTFPKRVERYKVACQFLWADFREALSRMHSEPQVIRCPADPPESESEPEAEQ